MDEEEWFKKHPSYLKYKKIMMLTSQEMDALDDTQIDKQKVKEVIDRYDNHLIDGNKLKMELGLE